MSKATPLNRFGSVLLLVSIILAAVVAYFTPDILAFFGNETLIVENVITDIAIRIYAGFLVSTAVSLIVQFLFWASNIWGLMSDETYINGMNGIKPVRNFNAVVVGVLYLLLFLFAGITVVRL